jgi:peroxiredoxin
MKRYYTLTLLLALGSFCAAQTTAPSPAVTAAFKKAGLPVVKTLVAPSDFTLPLLTGERVSLSGLRGKVVFLNFWATWCPPCRAEMPDMETVHQRLKGQGLEMLALDSGEKSASVAAFIKQRGFTFPVALDTDGRVSAAYGVSAIPTTCLTDRQGRIVSRVVGAFPWDTPAVIAALETLLADGQP